MNHVLYSIKRIFHRSIAFGKHLLTGLGLTPARFDMLHVIFFERPGMRQSDLRRVLGVTAPTVSRMLASLEALGLALRVCPTVGDRRQREVRLTDQGRECIRRAMHAMYDGDAVGTAVENVFLVDANTDEEKLEAGFALDGQLFKIRRAIGDRGTLRHRHHDYDWWPPPGSAVWGMGPAAATPPPHAET